MEVSVLIPARAGSTRLPGKNNLKLGELSLVNIAATQGRRIFPDAKIYVSTNDHETDARAFGEVIRRPDELCTAEASTIDAVKHALKTIKTEWVCLLQADHPFRDVQKLKRQIDATESELFDSIFTVTPFHGFLYDCDAVSVNRWFHDVPRPRSQDMRPRFLETGELYLFRRSVISEPDFIFGRKKMIDGANIMDVHTQDDYEISKKLWSDSWLW